MTKILIDDAHRFTFAHEGITHRVYRDGSGPGVLILHELPGMTPECIQLGQRVMDAGYTTYLPLLFGNPGDNATSALPTLARVTKLCIQREFECLATDKTSRISHWLRALCVKMKSECDGKGVGAIGMCLTGSVILSVMLEQSVLVPVLSQPALPFHNFMFPGAASTAERKRALGIHPTDLEKAVARSQRVQILGYRFTTDPVCPRERFDTMRETFRNNFRGVEIPTGPENPGNIPDKAHSVLTKYFVDEVGHPTRVALDEILSAFAANLV